MTEGLIDYTGDVSILYEPVLGTTIYPTFSPTPTWAIVATLNEETLKRISQIVHEEVIIVPDLEIHQIVRSEIRQIIREELKRALHPEEEK